jgi:hypothetical protein
MAIFKSMYALTPGLRSKRMLERGRTFPCVEEGSLMATVTTKDSAELHYKDWGSGPPELSLRSARRSRRHVHHPQE